MLHFSSDREVRARLEGKLQLYYRYIYIWAGQVGKEAKGKPPNRELLFPEQMLVRLRVSYLHPMMRGQVLLSMYSML